MQWVHRTALQVSGCSESSEGDEWSSLPPLKSAYPLHMLILMLLPHTVMKAYRFHGCGRARQVRIFPRPLHGVKHQGQGSTFTGMVPDRG